MELKLNKDMVQSMKTLKELQSNFKILEKLIRKQYGNRK